MPDKPLLLSRTRPGRTARRPGQAWRTGHALQKIGVEMGDYVSVWIPTSPMPPCGFGSKAIGGVTPTQPGRQGKLPRAHAQGRRRQGARRTSPARRAARRDRRRPSLEQVVIVGGPPPAGLAWPTVTLDELLDGVPDVRPTVALPIEPWIDLSLIYTFGTTGPSKGVRAAHAPSGTTRTASSSRTSTRATGT